jgi:hypothetical protein
MTDVDGLKGSQCAVTANMVIAIRIELKWS